MPISSRPGAQGRVFEAQLGSQPAQILVHEKVAKDALDVANDCSSPCTIRLQCPRQREEARPHGLHGQDAPLGPGLGRRHRNCRRWWGLTAAARQMPFGKRPPLFDRRQPDRLDHVLCLSVVAPHNQIMTNQEGIKRGRRCPSGGLGVDFRTFCFALMDSEILVKTNTYLSNSTIIVAVLTHLVVFRNCKVASRTNR